jgi:hypothetical protein
MRRASDADLGKGQMLRFKARRADKGSMVFEVRENASRRGRRRERESGQALVEFALIVPLFLMIVVGVIQFGVALNFWLDLQRLANQGARSAAVNCGSGSNQCGPTGTLLEDFLDSRTTTNPDGQVVSGGNTPDLVEICYVPPSQPPPANWAPDAGDAVRVRIRENFNFFSALTFYKDNHVFNIDLDAEATMRLEQKPTSAALPDRTLSANQALSTNTPPACTP